jgi:uncharacterized protein
VFRTGLIIISTLMHLYVFWRASSASYFTRQMPLKILFGVGFVLWLLFILGRLYGHDETSLPARILEFIGMNWMAILFLLFFPLLAADVITGFGFIFPRIAPTIRGWAIVFGLTFSIIALFQGLRPPVIQKYEVGLKDLPDELDGTVIVAVSDTHIGSLIDKSWLEARVRQIIAQDPDIVVFLGDIVEGHDGPRNDLVPVLKGITARIGKYAVTGNHEFHGGGGGDMQIFKKSGFKVLHDNWLEVRPGFIVAGVDDLTSRRRYNLSGDPVSQALKERPSGATIFLSHTPWETEKAAENGVDLMLSGHTHGGQVWPFGYFVKRVYPLLGGQYDVNGMTVIVCRGAGTWGPRMRLWRPGEIMYVTLHKSE